MPILNGHTSQIPDPGGAPTPSQLLWRAVRFSRRMWIRVAMFAVLAVVAAAAAPLFEGIVPTSFAERIGVDSVRPILDVLAMSMLAVTTFSLSVMVAAHRSASVQVTPRVHRLLLQDTRTHTVLATFLGAFVYALTSIVAINADFYTSRSVALSFVLTVLVIVFVVVTILRWIEHLSRLGSMLETTRAVEGATERAFRYRLSSPYMGGRPTSEAPDNLSHVVRPTRSGYVTHIDTGALTRVARADSMDVRLCVLPGAFVTPESTLAEASRAGNDARIRNAVTVSDAREFDQDPRFGLIVLSEIAQRALSPGVNDPGTAIDVIGRVTRLLRVWTAPSERRADDEDATTGRLFVPALSIEDLVDDGFGSIARDGAAIVEIGIRLQKSLATLVDVGDRELAGAARAMSERAHRQARAVLDDHDLRRVEEVMPAGGVVPPTSE